MKGDELEWIGKAMEGLRGDLVETDPMLGARCPKCNAADFAKLADLYSEAAVRASEGQSSTEVHAGQMTDAQLLGRFTPPRRNSALGVALAVLIPLGAASGYVYHRFGETPAELAAAATIVISAMVMLTMMRAFSDKYYAQRQKWNKTFVCRQCGQLVAG